MDDKAFKKAARFLKVIYRDLDDEAIRTNVPLTSAEYKRVQDKLREKTLDKLGFSLEDYNAAKKRVISARMKKRRVL